MYAYMFMCVHMGPLKCVHMHVEPEVKTGWLLLTLPLSSLGQSFTEPEAYLHRYYLVD